MEMKRRTVASSPERRTPGATVVPVATCSKDPVCFWRPLRINAKTPTQAMKKTTAPDTAIVPVLDWSPKRLETLEAVDWD